MVTAEQLKRIMPGLSDKRSSELLPFLQAAITEFAIDAPPRSAAFLAQLAHESGQFRFMEELWGPTPAQQRYEPKSPLATTLGNTEPGDGRRFKGRGPIQITGRANYRHFGDLLSIQLVDDPPSAASPDLAFRIAALFWSKKGLNELADLATDDAFREITRRINGGFNGLDERRKFYAAACTVLGVVHTGPSRGMRAPMPADEPVFERGYEAIRSAVAPRAGRKSKSAARKKAAVRKKAPAPRKPVTRKKTLKRTAAGPRRAKAAAKKRRPVTAGKRRKN